MGPAPLPEGYEASVEEWKKYRVGVLTDSTGWLRLVDLIWLDEGVNTFGSGESVDIRFPEGTISDFAGRFILADSTVRMEVDESAEITWKGDSVSNLTLIEGDHGDERIEVQHDPLIWFIDKRDDDQYGVRLFSLDTPKADAFEGFPAYPLDPAWHMRARFIPYPEGSTIRVVNVLGNEIDRPTPGRLEFTIDGNLYTLDAFEGSSGLFLMMADETNRTETYQAGRYLMVDPPDEDGYTVIDFNRAYNMPCSFNRFTTCQLPPPQNRLDVAITAGEQRPVDWDGI
ncbi:MAG: DUF1684 domain-containing protein [Balneolaceae bacterium]